MLEGMENSVTNKFFIDKFTCLVNIVPVAPMPQAERKAWSLK